MEWKTFSTTLERFDSNLWHFHIKIPTEIVESFTFKQAKRVICKIDEKVEFQCALMPKGEDGFFILLNKKHRDLLSINTGDKITVSLQKDESEYGLPMPDELRAVLDSDLVYNNAFHSLTPGTIRTLLHWVGIVKNPDLRIRRALAIFQSMEINNGKPDFKMMNEIIKNKL